MAESEDKKIRLVYRNHRGEIATRTITPERIWFGATDWHPELQWFLTAFDHEKLAPRDFALRDIGPQLESPDDRSVTALKVDNRQLREALKPFGSYAVGTVDDHGWTSPMGRTRIVDWFGPSDFRGAREALGATEQDDGLSGPTGAKPGY